MDDPVSFLGATMPAWVSRRIIVVEPGERLVQLDQTWSDELVVVERGPVEVELLSGNRCEFAEGDVLWLEGLSVCALHNHGAEAAVVVAIKRRPPPTEAP